MSQSIPPPPAAPPMPEPRAPVQEKKPVWKRWWFWVAVVVVIGIIGSASGGADDSGNSTGTGDSTSAGDNSGNTAPEGAGIGDPVGDGQFTFTVNSVKCGASSIGSGVFASKAQGEYCLVSMKVQNTGDESQYMDASSQYMFIGDKKYSTSSDALLALDDSDNFFLQEINPGNSVEGTMVFDITKGGKPDRLELHDSPFSGGVTVNI